MNIINRIFTFFKETRLEMKKVNWLSRREVLNYTLLVLGVMVVMALLFGVLDFVFAELLNKLILSR